MNFLTPLLFRVPSASQWRYLPLGLHGLASTCFISHHRSCLHLLCLVGWDPEAFPAAPDVGQPPRPSLCRLEG